MIPFRVPPWSLHSVMAPFFSSNACDSLSLGSPRPMSKHSAAPPAPPLPVVVVVVVGLLLVVVVILFSMRRPASHTTGPDGRPVLLNNQQIDDFINAPLNRDRNAVEARSALEKAILVLERTNKIDHQYKAVYWFKVARAYGRVLNSEEEQKYSEASRRLTKQVQDMYRNAYAYQKDHQYVTSERIFRNLLEMLPSMERRDGNSELRENIIAHVANITRLSAANNRR